MSKTKIVLAVLLAGFLISVAVGAGYTGRTVAHDRIGISEAYIPQRVVDTYRDGLTAVEAATDLEPALGVGLDNIAKLSCGGATTVTISGRFSVASANATIVVARYSHAESTTAAPVFRSLSTSTITAGSVFTVGGDFPSINPFLADTAGCSFVRVYVESVSAGSVDLFAEVH